MSQQGLRVKKVLQLKEYCNWKNKVMHVTKRIRNGIAIEEFMQGKHISNLSRGGE